MVKQKSSIMRSYFRILFCSAYRVRGEKNLPIRPQYRQTHTNSYSAITYSEKPSAKWARTTISTAPSSSPPGSRKS